MKLIVAKDLNGAIGKDNQLPWRLSWDLKNFKALTTGNTILMGRKTFESIGKPLPNRRSLVLTRNPDFRAEGVEVVHSLEQALAIDPDLFVIGGAELYQLALPLAAELHLTVVHTVVKGADAFFTNHDLYDWLVVEHWTHLKDEKNQFDANYYHLIRQ